MEYNSLIFGKDNTERVVGLEVKDDTAYLFIQNEVGDVNIEKRSNRFWILGANQIRKDWMPLDGNLFYKWGKQYKTREEFLKDRNIYKNSDIYSIYNPKESYMVNYGTTFFKGLKHTEVTCLSFDIETTGINLDNDSYILLISNTFRKNGKITKKLFAYDDYKSQGELIIAWCNWVREIDPSIILGHNIEGFDLQYIHHVSCLENIRVRLGRDGSDLHIEDYESKFRVDGTRDLHYHRAYIYGREIMDTMFLAYKYDAVERKYNSYGLKNIIKQEGLEIKDRVFYDASKIRHNYKIKEEWEKIKKYCVDDSDDALTLFDLTVAPFFYSTQSIPKSPQAVTESASGSQINSIMVRAYLQNRHSIPQADTTEQYEGAISNSKPGIYSNVFKVDVKSMYPSIIIEYKIYNKDKDPKAYLLELANYFTNERFKNKDLYKKTNDTYYSNLEKMGKIFINSLYGFFGANGLNFNSPRHAAQITEIGRNTILKAIKWAEDKKFTVCNVDTDSISFTNNGVNLPIEWRKSLLQELNSLFPKSIVFADDGYFPKVIILATKNYVLFDGIAYKVKGSSLKDPKKEEALREFIQDIIDTIMVEKYDYKNIYDTYAKEALNVTDIKRWASRKTITEAVLNPERTNEQKVFDCIQGTEYVEGDRIYCYFRSDNSLGLVEKYDGDYNKEKLLEKLFKTSEIFDTVIPEGTFVNYKLKKNKILLEKI